MTYLIHALTFWYFQFCFLIILMYLTIGPFSRDCGHLSLFGSFSCGLELTPLLVLQLWLTLFKLILISFSFLYASWDCFVIGGVHQFTGELWHLCPPTQELFIRIRFKITAIWTGYSHH